MDGSDYGSSMDAVMHDWAEETVEQKMTFEILLRNG